MGFQLFRNLLQLHKPAGDDLCWIISFIQVIHDFGMTGTPCCCWHCFAVTADAFALGWQGQDSQMCSSWGQKSQTSLHIQVQYAVLLVWALQLETSQFGLIAVQKRFMAL